MLIFLAIMTAGLIILIGGFLFGHDPMPTTGITATMAATTVSQPYPSFPRR